MPVPRFRPLAALFAGLLMAAASAATLRADETVAFSLHPDLLFSVSGGTWEDSAGKEETDAQAVGGQTPAVNDVPAMISGYFRLIAVRQSGGAAVYLQKIARTDDGFSLVETLPVDEINALSTRVIDIRPDGDGNGLPGFGAFVHLKTDPAVAEPETWSVFIDEFGDLSVSRGTN